LRSFGAVCVDFESQLLGKGGCNEQAAREYAPDGPQKSFGWAVLCDITCRTRFEGTDPEVLFRVHAEDQHRYAWLHGLDYFQQLNSILAGQADIQEDDIPNLFPDHYERFRWSPGLRQNYVWELQQEHPDNALPNQGMIVYQ
jgi:hypothetical protein